MMMIGRVELRLRASGKSRRKENIKNMTVVHYRHIAYLYGVFDNFVSYV